MDLKEFVQNFKKKVGPESGMILIHNGVVRGCSRTGERVASITVKADRKKLGEIMDEASAHQGISAVACHINEGDLEVGDDIMLLAVAGDIRENVIEALSTALNRIKNEVTAKQEH
ncbi:MAG TPA: molybdenum cofactor biosynthesis protein MoaE [Thermodesulfobacteriaceae bacterium]|nr:molybdenum cofactor biosynthesis protein MoaE [Thermodesulfobacteriaceae bacterium]